MSKPGIVLPYWMDVTKEDLLLFSKLAEDLGYGSIWFPEMWGRDAFTVLSYIAANTTKIKIATGIISVYSRSPSIIAQTSATLDEFSDGRFFLGLGMSSLYINEFWHGVKFDKPLQRTREYIEIIRMALSGKRVNYQGEIFNLKGLKLLFKPYRENIPIYVAAIGPKNIKLTSEIADGWIPYLCSIDFINQQKKILHELNSKLIISPFIPTLVSENREDSRQVIREFIAYYIASMGDYYYRLISSYGFSNEADMVKELWKNDREKAINSVSDELMDLISISGTKEEGLQKLAKYQENVDFPILMFPFKSRKEQIVYSLESLALKS